MTNIIVTYQYNVLVTPHMAAQSQGALCRVAQDVALGVLDVLEGRQPKYVVNPEVINQRR